jgi:hypothetical protein
MISSGGSRWAKGADAAAYGANHCVDGLLAMTLDPHACMCTCIMCSSCTSMHMGASIQWRGLGSCAYRTALGACPAHDLVCLCVNKHCVCTPPPPPPVQALADKKKGITDEDLLALVGDEVHQAAVVWELVDLQVKGGDPGDW